MKRNAWMLLGLVSSSLVACAPTDSPSEPGPLVAQAYTARASYPVGDEGTEAFTYRASEVLLGRPIADGAELNVYLNAAREAGTNETNRRRAILDRMFLTEDFGRRWTTFLGDFFGVGRTEDVVLGVPAGEVNCYTQPSGAAVTAELAQAIASMDPFAADTSARGGNLHDVFESSVLADNLTASFFATLVYMPSRKYPTPDDGPARTALFHEFNTTFLGRDQQCISCHTTPYSVSGETSGFDRHAPSPWYVERAVFGDDRMSQPLADLAADFRVGGYVATSYFSGAPRNESGRAPWGLSPTCGTFLQPPAPEPACVGQNDQRCVRSGASVRLGRPALLDGAASGSTYRLYQKLATGIQSLRRSPPDYANLALRTMDPDRRSASPLVSERAFALLVAQRFANAVWKEAYGSSLVLENQFPRNAAQRDQLLTLARVFVRGTKWNGAFSLQSLLREITLAPEFNAGTGSPRFARLFNPFTVPDPRDPGASSHYVYPAAETCDGSAPSYRSCVRQIMTAGGCYHCHVESGTAPTFAYDDLFHPDATVTTDYRISLAECQAMVTEPSCLAVFPDDVERGRRFTCADLMEPGTSNGRPGSRIAVRTSCTSNTTSSQRMPPPPTPAIPAANRAAIWKWVSRGSSVGAVPSLSAPLTAAESSNTVGDSLHWVLPAALARTVAQLGAIDYREPSFIALAPLMGSLPSYVLDALGVKYRVDNAWRAGFSGQNLVTFDNIVLRSPTFIDGTSGALSRAINDAAAAHHSLGQLVEELRLETLGERGLAVGEWTAISAVLGGAAYDSSVATLVATNRPLLAMRLESLLRTWMKSPHALLSHRAPVQSAFEPWPFVIDIPLEILTARSNLRGASKCALPDWIVGQRALKKNEVATLPDACRPAVREPIALCAKESPLCRVVDPALEQAVSSCVLFGACKEIVPLGSALIARQQQALDTEAFDESAPAATWQSAVAIVPWAGRNISATSKDVYRVVGGNLLSVEVGQDLKAGDVLFFRTTAPGFALKGDPVVAISQLDEPYTLAPGVAGWIAVAVEPKLLLR